MLYVVNIVIFIAIACLTFFLVYFYASKRTPFIALMLAFIGWTMGLLIIGLLPLDIYMSANNYPPNDLDKVSSYWKILYWTSFFLCWLIFPILIAYLDNGYFNWREKLVYAVKYHLTFLVLMGISGIVILFLALLFFRSKLNWSGIVSFVVSASNAWGMVQIIFFLSYGMIALPREFWKNAHLADALKESECQLGRMSEELQESKKHIEGLVRVARNIGSQVRPDLAKYLKQIVEESKEFKIEKETFVESPYINKYVTVQEITYETLVSLHYDVIACANEAKRIECLYNKQVQDAIELEDTIKTIQLGNTWDESTGPVRKFVGKCRWYWHAKIHPKINATLAVILGTLSCIILISECTLLVEGGFDRAIYKVYTYVLTLTYAQAMIFTLLLLSFLCLATYYGIFRFRVSGFYGLYPYHHTEPSNLVFSALYLVKLTAPLCLNFLMIVHFEGHQQTVFDRVAGEDATLDFVRSFLQWFPCVILVLCLSNYFNLYSRIMKWLKLDEFTYYDYFDEERFETGKQILAKERTARTSARTIELPTVERASAFLYVKENL